MMMIKTTKWMLMGLLTVGLGMGLVSCKEEMSEEERAWHEADPYEKGSEDALDFWTVISQLTSLQSLPDDWKTATFEPTIGKASEAAPYTRVVVVADAAEAVAAYSSLIGLSESLPDNTTSNDFSTSRVARLNYALSGDGQSVATVEVKIKQMPRLKKIVYQTPEQAGENATLHGTAYYRFGDVVSRVRPEDGQTEYWICVNPASSITGKVESHWISVSDLPDANVYTWRRSDDQQVQLPTAICTKYTYIHDFAELLYVMLHTDRYFANLGTDSKLTIFSGHSRKNIQYNNEWFFKRVDQAWQENQLYSQVLYATRSALEDFTQLDVFCKGYSWVMGKTGTLYTYTYNGKNWKTATWTKRTYDFKDTAKDAFNIHYWGLSGTGNSNWEPHRAFVARYATGQDICRMAGTAYDWKTALSGCTDVYVYNKYFYKDAPGQMYNLNADPEVTTEEQFRPKPKGKPMDQVAKEDIGKIIGADGMIYANRQDATAAGTTPVAMVADTYNTGYSFITSSSMGNSQWESLYGIKKGIALALEDGNPDKLRLSDDKVSVDKYDRSWYDSHKVNATGAAWYVPNIYHWQRLLLPHGCTEFWTRTYLNENYLRLSETSDTWRPGGYKFLQILDEAGVEISTGSQGYYLMADGMAGDADYCMCINRGNKDRTCFEFSKSVAERCRYVLTW